MNAIKKLMDDKNPELLVRLGTEMFGNTDLGKFFLLIKRFYLENGEFIGWDTLVGVVNRACESPGRAEFLTKYLLQIRERDVDGLTADLLTAELEDFRSLRAVMDISEELVTAVETKDASKVKALYKKGYEQIFVESEYKLAECDMANMAGKKVKFNFRKTGLEPLDERGGLIEGGLTIIGGESKSGKTILATQFANYQYLNYPGSIAITSYEQSKEELRARILSANSGVDLGSIVDGSITKADELILRIAEAKFYCAPSDDIEAFCNSTAKEDDQTFFTMLFDQFPKRDNKFFLIDERLDWDNLFVKMELLRSTQGVKTFVVDYPYLIPRGASDPNLASWEYALLQNRKLKSFAHKHKLCIITPAQYDSKGDTLRFVSNAVNDCDLYLKMSCSDEDKQLNQATIAFGAYRNFLSVPGKPVLEDFCLMKEFDKSRFHYVRF
jgi:hypothetical protein